MDAGEFEVLLYTILSEEPFNNQIFHMTEETDDNTISDYVSKNFGMLIGEIITCLTCHEKKRPKVLKYDSFIFPLGEISHKNKNGDPLVMRKNSFGQELCYHDIFYG